MRCGLKRRIAKFLESKRDKERRGFFFYRSINRMHSYSEIVLKSWVEWLKDWVTVKTFLLVFCKARLVRWFMSIFEFSKLYPKISSVMEFVLWVYFDDLPTGWVSRFYCRPRFKEFFFFKQAFLFIKSVKDVFVGVEFILVTFVLNSFQIDDWNLFFVGAICIQEERFSQHEKRYYFDMAEIDFGLLFFLFSLFLVRLF